MLGYAGVDFQVRRYRCDRGIWTLPDVAKNIPQNTGVTGYKRGFAVKRELAKLLIYK